MQVGKNLRLLLVLLFLFPLTTYAVNGAFDYGFSEITRGMGGTGVALPQDPIITAINPAGMVWVDDQLTVGAVMYIPSMNYTATDVGYNFPGIGAGPFNIPVELARGSHQSNVNFFLLPDFGVNWMLDAKSSIGLAMYSLAGFGSSYDDRTNAIIPNPNFIPPPFAPPGTGNSPGSLSPGPFGAGVARSDLKQAITSLTYSRKIDQRSSIGIALLIGLQTLDVQGANSLRTASLYPNNFSNKGHAYSVGAGTRVGLLLGVLPNVKVGLSYQPRVYMTKMKKYKGLLADGGSFDYPPTVLAGFAWHILPTLVFAFDTQYIWFKDIKTYGNNENFLADNAANIINICRAGNPNCFGGSNGMGFGWNNSLAFKFGLQWQSRPGLWWRIGYNHAKTVFQAKHIAVNIVAPGGAIEDIITFGVTKDIGKHNRITGVLLYVPPNDINGINQLSGVETVPGAGQQQKVTIHASGVGIGVAWTWLFAAA